MFSPIKYSYIEYSFLDTEKQGPKGLELQS